MKIQILNFKSQTVWSLVLGIWNLFRISCLVFGICFVVSCGGSVQEQTGISFSETKGDAGYIQLAVNNSKSPSLAKEAQIVSYKILLAGEGIDPKEQTIAADANGAVIEGIPAGKKREIKVQAFNSMGQILREGVLENISITAGGVTPVSITLDSIPLVLNLADGGSLSNQRLYFKVLTDPGHSISVEGDQRSVTVDESGEAKIYPGSLSPGPHSFTILDTTNGKSSSLTLQLWEGSQIKGAPLLAASRVGKGSPLAGVQRLGQVLARASGAGVKGEELFPNIAGALWKTR